MNNGLAFSALVHAYTKVGKSTLANTSPAPRLLFDAESAHRWLPGEKIFWEPRREPPPQLGYGRYYMNRPDVFQVNWDTCVIIVREYSDMVQGVEWLKTGLHPFESANVDSISEIQDKCKRHVLRGSDKDMEWKAWNALLNHMGKLLRELRDLTTHPTRPLQSVILTAMTRTDQKGRQVPYLQGQIAIQAPYFFDIEGYLKIMTFTNPQNPSQSQSYRVLQIEADATAEAGNRVQGRLPATMFLSPDPNNQTVLNMIKQLSSPAQPVIDQQINGIERQFAKA